MKKSNTAAKTVDTLVIGGGAAGLMCAAQLGAQGINTIIIDHANKVGKKILMSGGGRCNFTNYEVFPTHYLSQNKHFCKSALSRYTQWDFLELVHKYEIPFHEKTQGQLFCDNKAKDILNMLLAECELAGVDIYTSTTIENIKAHHQNNSTGFDLQTSLGLVQCQNLVIASGGLSIPTMGATGFGYDIAQQFGLKITPKHASLVPFTLSGAMLEMARDLAGLSIPVSMTTNNTRFDDQLLFTHKGLSGPVVLQTSNYWWPGDTVAVDFLPNISLAEFVQMQQTLRSQKSIQNLLSEHLPKRFVQSWFTIHKSIQALAERTANQLQHPDIKLLSEYFHQWQFNPKGTEGYKTAEVTRGGVSTDEVSSKTFESKKQPGLYFIGEVLDVTGWLGGYNFQWAWASGWCAAQAIGVKTNAV